MGLVEADDCAGTIMPVRMKPILIFVLAAVAFFIAIAGLIEMSKVN